MVGVLAVLALLVGAAAIAPMPAILVAFTLVVAVGLFIVPKPALLAIAVFLFVQPVFVNLAGGADTPLGLALHRLHQAFAVAGVARIAFFFGWKGLDRRLHRWLWLTTAFLACGLVSALVAHVPFTTLALGAFLAVKFEIFLLLTLTVSWSERDCERIMRAALWLGPLLLASGVLVSILRQSAQILFVDLVLVRREDVFFRGDLSVMHGIFPHPGIFGWAAAVTGCYAVAALLSDRATWRAGAGLSLGASILGILGSLRRKPLLALPIAAFYGTMRFATGRRRWLVLAVFIALAGGSAWFVKSRLEVEYQGVQVYLNSSTSAVPRLLLYATGITIADAHFPLGAGFGRFGGYASVLDYSPLYDEYGLSSVPGLREDDPIYIEDTYWPHIAAETGWLGAGVLALLYLLLVGSSTQVALSSGDPATKALAMGAALALVETLVESAAGPVFEISLFAFVIAVPLGISLARAAEATPARAGSRREHPVPG